MAEGTSRFVRTQWTPRICHCCLILFIELLHHAGSSYTVRRTIRRSVNNVLAYQENVEALGERKQLPWRRRNASWTSWSWNCWMPKLAQPAPLELFQHGRDFFSAIISDKINEIKQTRSWNFIVVMCHPGQQRLSYRWGTALYALRQLKSCQLLSQSDRMSCSLPKEHFLQQPFLFDHLHSSAYVAW